MDDTLISSSLDFAQMRKDIGCPPTEDILGYVAGLSGTALANAEAVIKQQELADAQNARWMDGADVFVSTLIAHKIPMGIVTRNSVEATQIKLTNNDVPITTVLTREDAPAKPDPTGLLRIAKQWDITPENIAYVGDYRYDILAANNANMQAWSYGYREEGLNVAVYFDCWHALRQRVFDQ